MRHVRIGRRSGQSLARGRHTRNHEAHSTTRGISHENGGDGEAALAADAAVTVLQAWRSLRKKLRLGLDEFEQAHDLRAKLRGQQQLAVGDEVK